LEWLRKIRAQDAAGLRAHFKDLPVRLPEKSEEIGPEMLENRSENFA